MIYGPTYHSALVTRGQCIKPLVTWMTGCHISQTQNVTNVRMQLFESWIYDVEGRYNHAK